METYIHTFRCGHKEEVMLSGRIEYRKRLLSLDQGKGLCPECKKKAFERKSAAMAEEAERRSIERGYPTLSGSIKQISWANTIRAKAVIFFKAKARFFGNAEKTKQIMQELKELINNNTDASFWIDNRSRFVLERTNYLRIW